MSRQRRRRQPSTARPQPTPATARAQHLASGGAESRVQFTATTSRLELLALHRHTVGTTLERCVRPCIEGRRARQLSPAGLPQTVFGQLLGHQEAVQVTRARAACPLRLGWKKSRALTWLALNWTL